MHARQDRRILRLPADHQMEALVRLSQGMSACNLANHRLQTCHTINDDIDRLEAELEIMLSRQPVADSLDPLQIAQLHYSIAEMRRAVDSLLLM